MTDLITRLRKLAQIYGNSEVGNAVRDAADALERQQRLLAECLKRFADVHEDDCARALEEGEMACSCGNDAFMSDLAKDGMETLLQWEMLVQLSAQAGKEG